MMPKPLISNQEAIDVGLTEASKARLCEATLEDLTSNLETTKEDFALECGARNRFREWWRRGVEAGFWASRSRRAELPECSVAAVMQMSFYHILEGSS
jgi:hypothetical protein